MSATARPPQELEAYLNEFSRIALLFGRKQVKSEIHNTKIYFNKLSDNLIGICYPRLNRVEFDSQWFRRASKREREEIIFHELGHCILELDHREGTIMQGAGVLNSVYYKSNYKLLINDLFGCKTGDCVEIEWREEKYE